MVRETDTGLPVLSIMPVQTNDRAGRLGVDAPLLAVATLALRVHNAQLAAPEPNRG